MIRERIDLFVAPFLIVLILSTTWFFGTEAFTRNEAAVEAERVTVQQSNTAQTAQIVELRQQNKKIDQLRQQLEDLRTVFPQQQNLTPFISTVGALADQTGVTVTSLVPEAPLPYVPGAVAATGTGALATTGSGAAARGSGAVPGKPLATANLYTVRVSIVITGSKPALGAFIDQLQHEDRLFVLNSVSAAAITTGSVTATISGYIFVAQRATAAG